MRPSEPSSGWGVDRSIVDFESNKNQYAGNAYWRFLLKNEDVKKFGFILPIFVMGVFLAAASRRRSAAAADGRELRSGGAASSTAGYCLPALCLLHFAARIDDAARSRARSNRPTDK